MDWEERWETRLPMDNKKKGEMTKTLGKVPSGMAARSPRSRIRAALPTATA